MNKCIEDCRKALELHKSAKTACKPTKLSGVPAVPLQHDGAGERLMLGRCLLRMNNAGMNNANEAAFVLAEALALKNLPSLLSSDIICNKKRADDAVNIEIKKAEKAEKVLLGELETDEARPRKVAAKKEKARLQKEREAAAANEAKRAKEREVKEDEERRWRQILEARDNVERARERAAEEERRQLEEAKSLLSIESLLKARPEDVDALHCQLKLLQLLPAGHATDRLMQVSATNGYMPSIVA